MMAQEHPEQLLTDVVSVRSHGDYQNRSVGVILPHSSRQVLGIDGSTDLVVRSWRDRIRIAKPPVEMPDDALLTETRTPVAQTRTLQLNIPSTACDLVGIERGDRLRCRTFGTHITLRPIEDVLDLDP